MLTFPEMGHKFDSLEQPRSLAAQEEHGQKSSRCILKSVNTSTRGCLCLTHSGDLIHPVLCPGCPWAGRAPREEWCCSLPGKMWGEVGATALQGANYLLEAPGCLLAASAQAAAGLLCSQPAARLPAGWRTMPVELSSVPGRRADGACGCRSCFPSAARTALEGIPNALGCPGSQGLGGVDQTSISSYCIIFLRSQNLLLAWGGYFDRQKKGNAVQIPPDTTSPGLHPPKRCVSDSAIKTSARLAPFYKHDKQRRYARQFS